MQKQHLGAFDSQVRSEIWQMPPVEAKHVLRFSSDEEDLCYRELKKKIHKQAIFQDSSQAQWKRLLAVPHLIAKAISEASPQRQVVFWLEMRASLHQVTGAASSCVKLVTIFTPLTTSP